MGDVSKDACKWFQMGKKVIKILWDIQKKITKENSGIGYFLEVDIDYPKKLFNPHKDLPILPESKKINKVEKHICGIKDKEKYVIHRRVLIQALNHELVFKKVHRVIQFNQKIG